MSSGSRNGVARLIVFRKQRQGGQIIYLQEAEIGWPDNLSLGSRDRVTKLLIFRKPRQGHQIIYLQEAETGWSDNLSSGSLDRVAKLLIFRKQSQGGQIAYHQEEALLTDRGSKDTSKLSIKIMKQYIVNFSYKWIKAV